MEEPRELTVEELEAEEIGEIPNRDVMSVVRPPSFHPLPALPLPEIVPDEIEASQDRDPAGTPPEGER
jgi:hypothetical protein